LTIAAVIVAIVANPLRARAVAARPQPSPPSATRN
jgi:hypothetical protein